MILHLCGIFGTAIHLQNLTRNRGYIFTLITCFILFLIQLYNFIYLFTLYLMMTLLTQDCSVSNICTTSEK
jgi:dolichyl-phosphate-mannose--protein O-mannosyl transferase